MSPVGHGRERTPLRTERCKARGGACGACPANGPCARPTPAAPPGRPPERPGGRACGPGAGESRGNPSGWLVPAVGAARPPAVYGTHRKSGECGKPPPAGRPPPGWRRRPRFPHPRGASADRCIRTTARPARCRATDPPTARRRDRRTLHQPISGCCGAPKASLARGAGPRPGRPLGPAPQRPMSTSLRAGGRSKRAIPPGRRCHTGSASAPC